VRFDQRSIETLVRCYFQTCPASPPVDELQLEWSLNSDLSSWLAALGSSDVIISHHLRAVFVKTRKTAGTSVELAMRGLCGSQDIITPVTPTDERLAHSLGVGPPQNHVVPLMEMRLSHVARWVRRRRRPYRFWNHMPATRARDILGSDLWDSYFTFTIERDPWDKAVSRYFWHKHVARVDPPPFSQWLQKCPEYLLSSFDLYSDGAEVIVDRVLRFESLQADLARVWTQLGVAAPELPRAKASHRPRGLDWRSMFTDADVDRVREVCQREISAFGYSFERDKT